MRNCFNYRLATRCGISKVKLMGEKEDWVKIYIAVKKLGKAYGLEWWTKHVAEIVDKFCMAYEGEVDQDFWRCIFKYYKGSSGYQDTIDGWVLAFFPYIGKYPSYFAKRSLSEAMKELDEAEGREFVDKMPPGAVYQKLKTSAAGVSVMKFAWYYSWFPLGYYNMIFASGFAGAAMTEEGYVMPKLAWVVADL